MANLNNTKRALGASILSILLCVTMLLGTTFAWFTDTATNTGNRIVAGNLDVDLLMYVGAGNPTYSDIDANGYASIADGKGDIFEAASNIAQNNPADTVWEPGKTQIVYLAVQNDGNLDLRYDVQVKVTDLGLASALRYTVIQNVMGPDGAAIADVDWSAAPELEGKTYATGNTGKLTTTKTIDYFALAVHMEEEAGNEYKGKSVELDVTVLASQLSSESDVFGSDYDQLPIHGAETVDTVAAAETLMNNGKAVVLANCVATETIDVPDGATLALSNVTIHAATGAALQAAGDANITIEGAVCLTGAEDSDAINAAGALNITGNGSLKVVGNNGAEDTAIAKGGSGIEAKTITIDGLTDLTAIANGRRAYGIGGDATEEITITNTHISTVRGGYEGTDFEDKQYAKNAAEGGAAIGSGYNGAVITLTNVTIDEVLGGSKAAGIGAVYHIGVTVNIDDCIINNVVGGTSAAGIGGSRIGSDNPADQDVFINIKDSTITAQGGYYGAGIGSGYDTHCTKPDSFPICTINITGNSKITATGGKYAAGVGTGYHAGGLDGVIESTVTVNAVSVEKFYKDTYTQAQDIGFGVIDPTRDGLNNTCSINYQGTEIGVPAVN